ncbi:MAG: bifunctional DNA-formamidopyrimidine glycosylase/DNA-(apurinic or apyrimidinic site) lyase [Beijerinckiaceae bacterium]|nr:bifunctional DNA-formamidopyrimidine glycosylase/DNA-(apurinic or apyrimidinic site) lyase [Beijerinckiaceae bacterium]
MPELPEVETVRRGLEPTMVGSVIEKVDRKRADLRFRFPADFDKRIEDQKVIALGRRAKYLLADLESGDVLVMHLGMSGSFRIEAPEAVSAPGVFHHDRSKDPAHDHVTLHLSGGARIVYNDPRRFGFMDIVARQALSAHPFFKDLGVEPLGNALDGALLSQLFAGKRAPLKAALLDQRLIAGLGNIYVCEALHRAGLSPKRLAGTISRKTGSSARSSQLATSIRAVLEEAVAAGGSSLRDHRQADGALGYFQHSFRVYDREDQACVKVGCAGRISRIVQSGRSTFYCSVCQR